MKCTHYSFHRFGIEGPLLIILSHFIFIQQCIYTAAATCCWWQMCLCLSSVYLCFLWLVWSGSFWHCCVNSFSALLLLCLACLLLILFISQAVVFTQSPHQEWIIFRLVSPVWYVIFSLSNLEFCVWFYLPACLFVVSLVNKSMKYTYMMSSTPQNMIVRSNRLTDIKP